MPAPLRQIQTVFPGDGPFRAVLWSQAELDAPGFDPADWLTDGERREHDALGNDKRRREWLAARVALKDLLVRDRVVRRPSDASVRKDARGCPRIVIWEPDTGRYAERACSISHSGPFVLVAYLRRRGGRIGVDLERRTWRVSYLRRKFVSPADAMLEKDDASGDGTILWSFKEALSKLLGTGWACGFRNLSCRELRPGLCEMRDAEERPYPGLYAWFGHYAMTVVYEEVSEETRFVFGPPKRPFFQRFARAWRLRRLRASRRRAAASPPPPPAE